MKLRFTSDGKLGYKDEDVYIWADFYENIAEKVINNKELSNIELDSIVFLLKKTAQKMRKKPQYFLVKNKKGRKNEYTSAFLRKEINVYARLGLAKNLSEARKKIAENYLRRQLPPNKQDSLITYDERLEKKIKTIAQQTANLNFKND